jgi:hypothetical protein
VRGLVDLIGLEGHHLHGGLVQDRALRGAEDHRLVVEGVGDGQDLGPAVDEEPQAADRHRGEEAEALGPLELLEAHGEIGFRFLRPRHPKTVPAAAGSSAVGPEVLGFRTSGPVREVWRPTILESWIPIGPASKCCPGKSASISCAQRGSAEWPSMPTPCP